MKGLTRTATFTFSAIVSVFPRKFCPGMTAVTCRAHVDSVGPTSPAHSVILNIMILIKFSLLTHMFTFI